LKNKKKERGAQEQEPSTRKIRKKKDEKIRIGKIRFKKRTKRTKIKAYRVDSVRLSFSWCADGR
jgi:hypothetical protein